MSGEGFFSKNGIRKATQKMTIHPVAPLTDANRRHYRRIQVAKRKLRKATSVDQAIELRATIGEATARIWRLRRK